MTEPLIQTEIHGDGARRTALIFLCGFLLYWFPFFQFDAAGQLAMRPLGEARIPGVLQRIALCSLLAAPKPSAPITACTFSQASSKPMVFFLSNLLFLHFLQLYYFQFSGTYVSIHQCPIRWLFGQKPPDRLLSIL